MEAFNKLHHVGERRGDTDVALGPLRPFLTLG